MSIRKCGQFFHHPVLPAVCLAMMLPLASLAEPQDGSGNDKTLAGDWRGESSCVVRPSGCHDEDSLYHVVQVKEKPGWFSLKADKIVDGKPVTMGITECSYDGEKHSLQCHLPSGTFQFKVQGNHMQGSMKLPDGTLWRKLNLTKVE